MSTLFEFIDCMTYKKQRINFEDAEIERAYEPYAIDNALSMCELLIPYVQLVSMLNLPKKQHEELYQELLPQRRFYFDWVKKPKKASKEERDIIADYYNCSFKKADEIVDILSKEELDSILKMYKYGVKKTISV